MRGTCIAAALLALLIPGAAAAPLLAFTDPAGDVKMDDPPTGTPYSGPAADGVDLLGAAVWIEGNLTGLVLTVSDLSALSDTDVGVLADTMLFMQWEQAGGSRAGRWTARADYQPGNSVSWRFTAEGPCLTFHSDGSCPGADRDIHDDTEGIVDDATNSVTILMPLEWAGPADPAVTWKGFVARTDAVWPSYPIYIGDSAQDLSATTLLPFGGQSPTPSGNNTSAPPSTGPSQSNAPHSSTSASGHPVTVAPTRNPGSTDDPSGSTAAKGSPSVGFLAALGVVTAVALRRRRLV